VFCTSQSGKWTTDTFWTTQMPINKRQQWTRTFHRRQFRPQTIICNTCKMWNIIFRKNLYVREEIWRSWECTRHFEDILIWQSDDRTNRAARVWQLVTEVVCLDTTYPQQSTAIAILTGQHVLNVLKLMDAGYCLYVHIFMKNIKSLEPFNFLQF